MNNSKKNVSHGLKWSAIERIATQFIQLIIMLVLGRMLGPKAFGLIGMMSIFIAISQTLVDSGFSNALIRKLDRNESDFATTFYFSIIVSLLCYTLIFSISPVIADFYGEIELVSLLRLLGITVIINSLMVVQRSMLTIELNFKLLAKVSMLSVTLSSTVAIYLAANGYGVWALVWQTLAYSLSSLILINYFYPWRIKEKFSKRSFDELFGFGSKLLAASLLDTMYSNIYQIIIGKSFSSSQLGFFTQAKFLSETPSMTLANIIMRVVYPLLSNIQKDEVRLKKDYTLSLKLTMITTFPIIFAIPAIATPLVNLSLGVAWKEIIPLISILCLGFALLPLHAINLNLLKVKGLSGLIFRLQVLKKSLGIVILFISYSYGIIGMCIGIAIHSYLSLAINTYYIGRIIDFDCLNQFKMLIPIWLLSIFAWSGASLIINQFGFSDILSLISTLVTGMSIYYILMSVFCNEEMTILKNAFFRKK